MRTAEGRLWQRFEPKKAVHRPLEEARWHFVLWEECRRYLLRQGLDEGHDSFPHDPDAIQDEAERLRLGRNGLSTAFFRLTSGVLPSGGTSSTILELFGPLPGGLEEGTFAYFYALRGGVRIHNGETTTELGEGDVLTIEYEAPSNLEPLRAVGSHDLPPRLIFVDCDSYRRVPHPVRDVARRA